MGLEFKISCVINIFARFVCERRATQICVKERGWEYDNNRNIKSCGR